MEAIANYSFAQMRIFLKYAHQEAIERKANNLEELNLAVGSAIGLALGGGDRASFQQMIDKLRE